MTISKGSFRIAAVVSFAVAVFQAVITFVPSWCLYFGAPEQLVSHPLLLLIAGLVAAIVFALFGCYALSGARDIRPLPLLRPGLVVIGALYLLRGLMLIPQVLVMSGMLKAAETVAPHMAVTSLVSLCIGVLYFAGILSGWRDLSVKTN